MYNSKQIENFIAKVNKEAEAAAQAIFDKYEYEFIIRVRSQMKPGDAIDIGMGTASINRETVSDNFTNVIASIQYTEQRAGFSVGEISK